MTVAVKPPWQPSGPSKTDPTAGVKASTQFVVIGAGGLGCPVVLGLVAAGASDIHVFDDDRVDLANLQRQVLYTCAQRGVLKAQAAARFSRGRGREIAAHDRRFDPRTDIRRLAEGPTPVVLECSDSAGLKFAVNDACVASGIPLVVGGVLGWRGQITVVGGGSACFRCVFESPPPAEISPTCGTVGVIGSAAGVVGYWMTLLALRVASEQPVGPALRNFDFRTTRITEMSPRRRPDCPACGTVDRPRSLCSTESAGDSVSRVQTRKNTVVP